MQPRAVIAPNEYTALENVIQAADALEMYTNLVRAEARGVSLAATRLRDGYVNPDNYLSSDSTPEYDSIARQIEYTNDRDIQVILEGVRDIVRRL